MTAVAAAPVPAPELDEVRRVAVTSRKAPIAFGVVTALFVLLLLLGSRAGNVRYRFSAEGEFFLVPSVSVPGMPLAWVCVALAVVENAGAVLYVSAAKRMPIWLSVVLASVLLVAFLSWAGAGSDRDFPVVRLIGGAVLLAVPLVFGALGGVIGERAGVVNIAIESQLLAGAFSAAIAGSLTNSPVIGLLVAILSGALVAWVLAMCTSS